jgi:tetratricopeptide (TPR) repeat protein
MKVIQSIVVAALVLSGINSFSQSAKESTQRGMELYGKQEFMEALLNLNKAIETDAKYSQAYLVRGDIKAAFEDYHGAMKDYNSAIENNPKLADAFFARGNAKMKLQDYYGAISDFSSVIGINENYVDAYFNRGRAKQFLLAFEDAINDCSKIIQISPKSFDAYYMRGLLRIEFGDLKQGCLDLSKAGELGDHKAYDAIKEKCNQKAGHEDEQKSN